MLIFVLCKTCRKHGRFIGTPDQVPIEVASKHAAYAILDVIAVTGAISEQALRHIVQQVIDSELADVEQALDLELRNDDKTFVDEALREQVAIWNEAAAACWRPDLFARSDFHAYVEVLDAPPPPFTGTPRSIN